jgi:16S rRNA processing protein RimM
VRVVVGRIGRAQGIRGEVNVEIRTDAPEERFSPGAVVLVEPAAGGAARAVTVLGHRWQGGRLVLALAGVGDRTAAEAVRGCLLLADVDIETQDDDEYHDLALMGLEVRDRSGVVLGSIHEVLHLPGQDVLAVARPVGPELLVPFVTEIVPEVDVEGGFVVVDLPEGLAELGLS